MKKHLFLTGEKQVGKSTLLQRIINEKKILPCGLITLPFYIEGEKRGYYFHQLSAAKQDIYNNVPAILRIGENKHIGVEEIFETVGVDILIKSCTLQGETIMVLDELGRAEKHFSKFLAAVEACLDGEKQIIGVMQKGAIHYENMLKKHPRVCIAEVTVQNRERLFDEIMRDWF